MSVEKHLHKGKTQMLIYFKHTCVNVPCKNVSEYYYFKDYISTSCLNIYQNVLNMSILKNNLRVKTKRTRAKTPDSFAPCKLYHSFAALEPQIFHLFSSI